MVKDRTETFASTTAQAMAAAGDGESARDIGALDQAVSGADRKLAPSRTGLVERLIYGPQPDVTELRAGGMVCAAQAGSRHPVVDAAVATLARGKAFDTSGRITDELRAALADSGAYGLVVPKTFGGIEASYLDLAHVEEELAANGLGAVAVEVSGQLTIGAGSLLGYGTPDQQRRFLPLLANGTLMSFALTEVGTGINAKKIAAYVEQDENGDFRLFADGIRNKLWITNAHHGGLTAIVARIGREGTELGLFVTRLPETDIGQEGNWTFRCEPSGVDAFKANHNARLHFHDYPIPAADRIPGDGVEVLFYCLRMGRCMLAAMSAGYQRMLARDASKYAAERYGVGGLVMDHELPQIAIGRMMGGSLQARALAYLALAQDAAHTDLAGLRDITKSASAQTALDSMVACEHVMGGRAFHKGSRVNSARANLHLFGIVEGEDEMIRMGMVRDVTQRFVSRYLAPLLAPIQKANSSPDGKPVPTEKRLLRIGLRQFVRNPIRTAKLLLDVAVTPAPYRLASWIVRNISSDLLQAPKRLVPAALLPRYRSLPRPLRGPARYAERELRRVRWRYLRLGLAFQLELTTSQLALQRLGQQIEWLTSILVLCHHAACQDESQWHVAALQSRLLIERVEAGKAGLRPKSLRKLQVANAKVSQDIKGDSASLFADLAPEPYGHPFR